jgi:hypothetical protein
VRRDIRIKNVIKWAAICFWPIGAGDRIIGALSDASLGPQKC